MKTSSGLHCKKRLLFAGIIMILCFLLLPVKAQAKTARKVSGTVLNVRKAPRVKGEWQKTEQGYRFVFKDPEDKVTGWIRTDGSIYYLDKKGYRLTGSLLYKGSVYKMDRTGKMYTGWYNDTMYFHKSGKRAVGWTKIGNYTYYFKQNGRKVTGWQTIDGKEYCFSAKGRMGREKWCRKDNILRYLTADGSMAVSEWVTTAKGKYYVDENGCRVFGQNKIDGKWCYFDEPSGLYNEEKSKQIIDPSRAVALTFDDGPGPYTMRLLTCLRNNHARATFFMVGSSVFSYPDAVRQMAAQDCELGNHSYSHANMANLSSGGISSQFSSAANAIAQVSGQYPTVARLPYGSGHNSSYVLGSIGLPSIYWSIDTRDWANTGNPSHTINAVLSSVQAGDIVLMHDIHASTVTAAETIIPALVSRGFQLVTVTELANARGSGLSSGRTYYSFK